jgi:3,4-dihydroxy 2-butanone 4-phosphate synthase/GTP cyclohydrolase II
LNETHLRTPAATGRIQETFGVKLLSVASLIEYRHIRECLVTEVRSEPFESDYGAFTPARLENCIDHRLHYALTSAR